MSRITDLLNWLGTNKDALTLIGAAVAGISAGGWALYKYLKQRAEPGKTSNEQAANSASLSKDKSFVTQLIVWAEVDADIYVDGQQVMTIDHSSGFDYAGSRVRIGPESMLSINARGVQKTRRVSDLCPWESKECTLRVGTAQLCDIRFTEAEKRASMGTSLDVPELLQKVQDNTRYSERAWAIERLGYIGDWRAKEGLIAALDDPEPWVPACAAEALGRLGDPTVLPRLKTAFTHYQYKERYGYMFERAIKDLEFATLNKDKTGRDPKPLA